MHIQLRWTWLSNRSSNYLLRSASGWSTGGTLDLEGSRRWPPLLKHLWEWFRCSQLGPPHLQLRSLGHKWCRWYHIIPYSMRMDAHSPVQTLSHVWLFVTPLKHTQVSLSITNCWSLLKLMSIESVMPSNYFILFRPLLLLPSIFPASGYFPMNHFFTSGGQSIAVSAFAAIAALPMNIHDWFPLGLTGWISLQSKGLSRVVSNTTVQKHQFFGTQLSLQSNSHILAWLLEKTIALIRWTFVGKVMSLLFNMLSRLVTTFLPRSKYLLISWLQSPSTVILEPRPKKQSLSLFPLCPHLFAMKWWDWMPWS